MPGSYSAIIAAAGLGERFGSPAKLKEKLGGKSVLSHSLDVFDSDESCTETIIVASALIRDWVASDPLTFASPKLKLVEGGETRAESVKRGVLEAGAQLLAIHDASRPNFGAPLLKKLLAVAKPTIGAVPAWQVRDPVTYVTAIGDKETGSGEPQGSEDILGPRADHRLGHVMEHVDTDGLYALQTPQVYYRESYLKALEAAGDDLPGFADDSALYVAGGFEVAVIKGRDSNLKIVTPGDLGLLRKLLGGPSRKKDKYSGLGW